MSAHDHVSAGTVEPVRKAYTLPERVKETAENEHVTPPVEARSSNEASGLDPRLAEWGYGSLEEAISHLGELIEDQAAFDGMGKAVKP